MGHNGYYTSSNDAQDILIQAFLEDIVLNDKNIVSFAGMDNKVGGLLRSYEPGGTIKLFESSSMTQFTLAGLNLEENEVKTSESQIFWHEIGHLFGDLRYRDDPEKSNKSTINFENWVSKNILGNTEQRLGKNHFYKNQNIYTGKLDDNNFTIQDHLRTINSTTKFYKSYPDSKVVRTPRFRLTTPKEN